MIDESTGYTRQQQQQLLSCRACDEQMCLPAQVSALTNTRYRVSNRTFFFTLQGTTCVCTVVTFEIAHPPGGGVFWPIISSDHGRQAPTHYEGGVAYLSAF